MCFSLIFFFFYLLPDLTVNLCGLLLVVPNIRRLPKRTDRRLMLVCIETALISTALISSTFTFFKFDVCLFFSSADKNSCLNRSTAFCLLRVGRDDIHYCTRSLHSLSLTSMLEGCWAALFQHVTHTHTQSNRSVCATQRRPALSPWFNKKKVTKQHIVRLS